MIRALVITSIVGLALSVVCFAAAAAIVGPDLPSADWSWLNRLSYHSDR